MTEGWVDLSGAGGGGSGVTAETQTAVSGIANSETTYTSGTVLLSGLSNVTVRSTTGQAFQFSAPASHAVQTGISAISNSDTTYVSGTVGLSALTNITIRSTTGNQFQFSGNPAQTVQAESFSLGVSTGGNTVGDTGVNSGQRYVFSGQGQVTLSQATGANSTTLGISVPNSHAVQTGISGISNSETGYVSGTVNLSGLGAVVVRSTTGQAFQISAPSQSVQAESLSFGVSTGGNTVGDTGVNSGQRIVLSGQGQVSLSQATGANSTTVGISVPNSHAVQTGISAISNSDTTYVSGTVGLSGLANITIRSTTGQQFQFSVAAPGAAGNPNSYWANMQGELDTLANFTQGVSTSYLFPMFVPYDISIGFMRLMVSDATAGASTTAATTNAASGSASWLSTWNFIVYSQGAGANSLSIQSYASTTAGWTTRMSYTAAALTGSNWSGSTQISYPMSAGTSSTSSGANTLKTAYDFSTNLHASFTGDMKLYDVPFATSLSAGNYWLGYGVSTNSASGGSATAITIPRNSLSIKAATQFAAPAAAEMNAATASSLAVSVGLGSFSVAAGATTASLHLSQASSSAAHPVPYFQFQRSA